ncbi:MAG TPA: response regulator [Pyrinomonadaceae bacterium]|nr:response regulator [Pyrinomonadaceae bacterium]
MYSRLHALYVDDDRFSCKLMKRWLEQCFGFDVSVAYDAERADKSIRSRPYELYLIDYCLPDITAVSLCRQILETNTSAEIVVYTALDRSVDRELALSAGARSYFVKPDQADELKLEIRKIVDAAIEAPQRLPKIFPPEARFGPVHYPSKQKSRRPRRKASGIV